MNSNLNKILKITKNIFIFSIITFNFILYLMGGGVIFINVMQIKNIGFKIRQFSNSFKPDI